MREIAAVVVTWNSATTIEACLASLPPEVPVAVVDNASADDTVDRVLAVRPTALVVSSATNIGFGAACNRGAALLGSCDLLLLNPDARLDPGCLLGLTLVLAADERVGVVGPLLHAPGGLLEFSWGDDPSLAVERARQLEQRRPRRGHPPFGEVDWVTGGCCLIRREAFDEVGGFDEGYFLYFEDLDLCRRIRQAGYKVVYQPASSATHQRGQSARQAADAVEVHYRRSQLRYYRRYLDPGQNLGLRLYLLARFGVLALREPSRLRLAWAGLKLAILGR